MHTCSHDSICETFLKGLPVGAKSSWASAMVQKELYEAVVVVVGQETQVHVELLNSL
jgi:hypothetical protein